MTARPSNLTRLATMTAAEDSPLYVTALAKGLSVLTAFGPSRPAMNLLELADATGLNKSTIQRSVFTLEAMGYLARDGGSKRYRLTVKSLEMGTGYLQTAELVERANPFIQQLNRQTGESCNLLEPWETDMVYVARFTSHKEMPIHVSNVALFNVATKKADRIGYKTLEDGRKVRIYKSNGEMVDAQG